MIIALIILAILLSEGAIFEMFAYSIIFYILALTLIAFGCAYFGKKYRHLKFSRRAWIYFLIVCGAIKEPKNEQDIQ